MTSELGPGHEAEEPGRDASIARHRPQRLEIWTVARHHHLVAGCQTVEGGEQGLHAFALDQPSRHQDPVRACLDRLIEQRLERVWDDRDRTLGRGGEQAREIGRWHGQGGAGCEDPRPGMGDQPMRATEAVGIVAWNIRAVRGQDQRQLEPPRQDSRDDTTGNDEMAVDEVVVVLARQRGAQPQGRHDPRRQLAGGAVVPLAAPGGRAMDRHPAAELVACDATHPRGEDIHLMAVARQPLGQDLAGRGPAAADRWVFVTDC